MFLEAMLDVSWDLGPMTETEWNNNWVADKIVGLIRHHLDLELI